MLYAGAGSIAAPKPVILQEGFEVSELSKMKNWEVIAADPSSVALDRSVFHTGKSSLRVQSGVGVGSEDSMTGVRIPAIPYRGQIIKITGWMKTKDVVVGSKDWLMAGIQICNLGMSRGTV